MVTGEILCLPRSCFDRGFKACKQMVKISFRMGDFKKVYHFCYLTAFIVLTRGKTLQKYEALLPYTNTPAVTRNYAEKSINNILDFISTSQDMEFLEAFYQKTLQSLLENKNDVIVTTNV